MMNCSIWTILICQSFATFPSCVICIVRSVDDINKLLNYGADKVSINTAAVENSKVIIDSSKKLYLYFLFHAITGGTLSI